VPNPVGAVLNPVVAVPKPVGAGPGPCGAMGAVPELFGAVPDLVDTDGAVADPFGAVADPFGAVADPFGAVADPFGAVADPFGAAGANPCPGLAVPASDAAFRSKYRCSSRCKASNSSCSWVDCKAGLSKISTPGAVGGEEAAAAVSVENARGVCLREDCPLLLQMQFFCCLQPLQIVEFAPVTQYCSTKFGKPLASSCWSTLLYLPAFK
jgi:hypothetical protein